MSLPHRDEEHLHRPSDRPAWLDAATDGDDPRYRDPSERNHFSLSGWGPGRRTARG